MYRIPIHKKKNEQNGLCCLQVLAMQCNAMESLVGEKLTTESHKKDRILISSSSFFYTFFPPLSISHASIFFCVELKRERCLLNDFCFRWWNRLVLSKFCLFKGRKRMRERANGSVMTAWNTSWHLVMFDRKFGRLILICECREKFMNFDWFIGVNLHSLK